MNFDGKNFALPQSTMIVLDFGLKFYQGQGYTYSIVPTISIIITRWVSERKFGNIILKWEYPRGEGSFGGQNIYLIVLIPLPSPVILLEK